MNKLPDKPGDLVRLAAMDFLDVSRNPKYIIEMSGWHRPKRLTSNKICYVCLAGGVIAGTLRANRNHAAAPTDYDEDTCEKLDSLDDLREGYTENFLHKIGYEYNDYYSLQVCSSAEVFFFQCTGCRGTDYEKIAGHLWDFATTLDMLEDAGMIWPNKNT